MNNEEMDLIGELSSPKKKNNQAEEKKALTIDDVARKVFEEYEEERNRPKVEDTHFKTTILIKRELNDKLDELCYKKKGLKNKLFNMAIQYILESGVAQEQAELFERERNKLKQIEKRYNVKINR